VPLGGFGLVGGMLWAGFAPLGSPWMYAGLIFTGAAGGCFMVPLYAFVQDKAHPDERARILSAINLMDCLATFVSVAIISGLKAIGLNASWQFIALAIPTFAAAIYVTRLVPSDLARLVVLSIVRAIYKVKAVNPTHVPREGGVLLLPNHVSYVDALIIGAACDRPVRFVMWDVLYKLWWLNWFLRVVGTVPISATRAKDAVRTVAAALKEGEVVCLFPEGQITRHGMINELRKGFELMARQAEVPVLPVYTDGLYGSIFSYEGGTCFRKWPKKLRYPVTVYFGQPLYGREGTIAAVRAQLQELSTVALLSHKEITASKDPAPRKQIVANATRLLQVELAREGDTLLCLDSAESVIGRTLKCYAAMKDDVHFATSLDILAACGDGRVVAVGSQTSCVTLRESREWARAARIGLCWDTLEAQMPEGLPRLARGLLDAATGALIATSVPDPIMPAPERDNQHGTKEATLGRLLPGLTIIEYTGGIKIRGMLPGESDAIQLPGVVLDSEGFLTKEAPPAGEASE
jgi:acyl-[acyl-carrier-protein]-phospholipid O-acyltransferase/long-chain-fatty-acid--[acyl-carrier-protein] ligase